MEFVAIGDIHYDKLDRLFRQVGLSAIDYQSAELERAVSYSKSHGIKSVVLLGDISEHEDYLSAEAHIALVKLFSKYSDINFHIILGNHDFKYQSSHALRILELFCDFLPNLFIYTEPTVVMIQGVKFNFLPFPHASPSFKDAINIGHLTIKGTINDNGMPNKGGIEVKHHWLMGHLHTNQDPYYPGTLYQTNFGESLPKGFYHVEAKTLKTGKLKVNPTFIKVNPGFILETIKAKSENSLVDRLEADKSSTSLYLYKVKWESNSAIDPSIVEKYPNIVKIVGTAITPTNSLVDSKKVEVGTNSFEIVREVKTILQKRGHKKHVIREALDHVRTNFKGIL